MLGVVLGVAFAPPAPAHPTSGPEQERPRPPAPTQPRTARSCDAELEALQARLHFQEMLYDSLWEERFGRPIQWPEDAPERYTREAFEGVIARSLADCDTDLSPRGVECTEPPCIGAFVFRGPQQLFPRIGACPAWSEAYGDAVTTWSGRVGCDDGTEETVLLLSPYWEEIAEPDDPVERENFGKRIEERWKVLLEAWTCGEDGAAVGLSPAAE